MPDLRRLRFLFVDFLVRIWLVKALERLIFPEPVFEKRFAAPLLVFILGIVFTPYPVSGGFLLIYFVVRFLLLLLSALWPDKHDHLTTFHCGRL